uniref:Hexosyltransferase n=1 Tax=Callorhinchus milii TaxID=7868 RepID=A0A4W3GRZ3_CALMI|eukprot:gi/632985693/ref/XP_007909827.1/ PREDICTED: beta-1,3-galactosyltransferase 4 [Callorhinchus milii]
MEMLRRFNKCRLIGFLRKPRLGVGLLLVLMLTGIPFLVDYAQEWTLRRDPTPITNGSIVQMRARAVSFNMEVFRHNASKYYLIPNTNACDGPDVFLVSFVISKTGHFQSREAIRQSWASVKDVQGHTVLILFALGVPESTEEQERIEEESSQYKDVVQGVFRDTYHNLTLKTIMIMQWFGTYCPAARYLLKVDDDVFLNYHNLMEHLIGLSDDSEDLYLGWVHRRVRPVRNKNDLYYVSESVYSKDVYPDYCSGTSYVVSKDVVLKVYVAALTTPLITIEDVFVGLCAHKMGVSPTHTSKISGPVRFHLNQCCYKSIYASHHIKPGEFLKIWKLVNDGSRCSLLAKYTGLFMCKALALLSPVINQ